MLLCEFITEYRRLVYNSFMHSDARDFCQGYVRMLIDKIVY